jgi:amino acid transporter
MKESIKNIVIGKGRDPNDPTIFHKLSLVAFLAWVGLGSDGMSSSCYGPSEIMLTLQSHPHLGIFVALASVFTIFIISTSYSQIIELFPSGGGGYLVASKLLSPYTGMVSGSALLIDYVLTITVSVASGSDALFSFVPNSWLSLKLPFALFIVILLTIANMRGIKESVKPLVPIFIAFIATHVFVIIYAIIAHSSNMSEIAVKTASEYSSTVNSLGFFGTLFIVIHAYSMGAGTYTGIEAVSNGLPVLKEPKVHTAKVTMWYMAFSLSFMVLGLMVSYLLFNVGFVQGKTLNAVLFENVTANWGILPSQIFVVFTLITEAAILIIAAQTGFIDGPRVLSNMALDRWVPNRFASLSDRLVTQNGILLMGGMAFVLMLLTKGDIGFLVVLYSINVFITFSLSQIGMVKHWWQFRKKEKKWINKIIITGIGASLSILILVFVVIIKFNEGGWITIIITGTLILLFTFIRKNYDKTGKHVRKFNELFKVTLVNIFDKPKEEVEPQYEKMGKTAVLLVNGFSGLGIHSILNIIKMFDNTFKNFAFIEVGIIDSGVFKGEADLVFLKDKIDKDLQDYLDYMKNNGIYAEGFSAMGLDVTSEILKLVPQIQARCPRSIFFGGQVVFPDDSIISRVLHNYTVFAVQRELYKKGIQFIILPFKV